MIEIRSAPDRLTGSISLPASKSIYNRVLIIRALGELDFTIQNTPEAEDSRNLLENLSNIREGGAEQTIDVGPAGTNMRFLTALHAVKKGEYILKGSERMHQRPIGILADALRKLGANIEYLGDEGFPPLRVKNAQLQGGRVKVASGVSSQYVSALMMIGPVLPGGLELYLAGEPVSKPYIQMTRKIMESCGATVEWRRERIKIAPTGYRRSDDFVVEADWSAASYWYAMAAMAKESDLFLSGILRESVQGDAILWQWLKEFGIHSQWQQGGVSICREGAPSVDVFQKDFKATPDLAQTFIALLAGLQIPGKISGLKTLAIKETNRIDAMKAEMAKFGASLRYENEMLQIPECEVHCPREIIRTYNDHRMAMALATLGALCQPIRIDDGSVVAKSYPGFWNDMKKVGFSVGGQ